MFFGMYGLLKLFDFMYFYRLEMGIYFFVGFKYVNLYEFWGDKLWKVIEKEIGKNEFVVNLVFNEYVKVVCF